MTWLSRVFGRMPPAPILLRVSTGDGERLDTVDLTVTWHPSGRTRFERQRTADGLAIIPWCTTESRARISIEGEAGRAEIEVARDRDEPDHVAEVRVSPARLAGS
jgi:hypothetical protein